MFSIYRVRLERKAGKCQAELGSSGAFCGLLSIVNSFRFKDLLGQILLLLSDLFMVSGSLAGRIVRKTTERQVKRLTNAAKREAEANAREVLAKSG